MEKSRFLAKQEQKKKKLTKTTTTAAATQLGAGALASQRDLRNDVRHRRERETIRREDVGFPIQEKGDGRHQTVRTTMPPIILFFFVTTCENLRIH